MIFWAPNNSNNTKAADRESNISGTQAWSLGELTNVSTAYKAGSIAIDNKTLGAAAEVTADQVTFSATGGVGVSNIIDNNIATSWSVDLYYSEQWSDCRTEETVQIEFGLARGITDLNATYGNSTGLCGTYSIDGTNWTGLPGCLYGINQHYGDPLIARYLKLQLGNAPTSPPCPVASISEVYIQAQDLARATHKTGATQIDGSEGGTKEFVNWKTFTAVDDKPSNTSIEYRFRTSPDGSTWTTWTDYLSGPTVDLSTEVSSVVGGTKYKYLQVESTLEGSDGSSTPAVDSYNITYHNDVKPNKPAAATAVLN